MLRLVAAKLGDGVIAIWGVVTIVFVVSRLLGDPAVLLLPEGASQQQLQVLRASLGLDRPIWVQYGDFLVHLLHGNFGQSFQFMQPALTVVLERMPATLILTGAALALGVLIGGIAGCVAAYWRGSIAEFLVMIVALLGQATPVFWLGIMLITFFAVQLHWLPTGGFGSPASLILPAVALATYTTASIARLLRSSMLDVLREEYVRTAHAKGLLPRTVFFWYVGRNSLVPVLTMVGILAGELLGGSVVTETVFSWPGVGRLIVQAIEANDFPVVEAGVTLIATIYVLVNILVDLLYGTLDPRIREQR